MNLQSLNSVCAFAKESNARALPSQTRAPISANCAKHLKGERVLSTGKVEIGAAYTGPRSVRSFSQEELRSQSWLLSKPTSQRFAESLPPGSMMSWTLYCIALIVLAATLYLLHL